MVWVCLCHRSVCRVRKPVVMVTTDTIVQCQHIHACTHTRTHAHTRAHAHAHAHAHTHRYTAIQSNHSQVVHLCNKNVRPTDGLYRLPACREPGILWAAQITKPLRDIKSKFQRVQVVQSRALGRMLLLDEIIQCSERYVMAGWHMAQPSRKVLGYGMCSSVLHGGVRVRVYVRAFMCGMARHAFYHITSIILCSPDRVGSAFYHYTSLPEVLNFNLFTSTFL